MNKFLTLALLTGCFSGSIALAGSPDSKMEVPKETVEPEAWHFNFSMPGWVAWEQGKIGLNGSTSGIRLGPNDIVPKIDMAASVRLEAQKGRFGIMAEYLYIDVSDGVAGGPLGVVRKIDVRTDEHLGQFALSWRLVERQRGWLDVYAGFRYTNLFDRVATQPDSGRISEVSAGLLDRLGQAIGAELRSRLVTTVAVPPIINEVADRVEAVKAKTARALARELNDKLNAEVSRTDDWWDPIIGLRGRYYFSKAVYFTGRADIGGFGVGSEFAWQVNAGIGCQLSRHIFAETTYRAYHVNYRNDGLVYDLLTHGPEVTVGINF